jgi:hypothetical protein
MRLQYLEADTKILIGAPAKPMSKRRKRKLSAMLGDIEEICEVHIPQIYGIGGLDKARLVLVIVIDPESAIPGVMERLSVPLNDFLQRETLDVWPIGKSHSLIGTIREANCVVGWRD